MDILVTAFDSFGGFGENSSENTMKLLADKRIKKLLLPTSYERSFSMLKAQLERLPASAVVMLGQAPRDKITLERVAINVADCSMADNDGVVLTDSPLIEGGDAAYFSTLPIKEMLKAADCRISNTAGTYVCNALFYKTARYLYKSGVPCGFIHIPREGSPRYFAAELNKMLSVLNSDKNIK